MNVTTVFRYTILGVSVAAMALGAMVMMGWLVPTTLPEQFQVVVGAVVFLYGAYRFVIAYFQKSKR
jgi:uncharacterized membrane protein